MFNLTELAERYLAYLKFNSYPFTYCRFLLQELNKRECDRLIERKMKEISKELEQYQVKDANYYYNKYTIEHEYFYYLNRINLDKSERLMKRSDSENMFNDITYSYLFFAIKHYVYFLYTQEIYKVDFKTELIEDIFKTLKPEYFKEEPILSLYYTILMLFLEEDNISNYYYVKEKSLEKEKSIPKHEMIWVYINLQSYCLRMIRKGKKEFLKELFDIYKLKLEKEIYAWQEMPATFYRGAVDTALKLKEFDWAKIFIEKYKDELNKNSKDATYFYSLALYEFAMKNFEASLELLSKVKYTDIYNKTELRCLTAELYYELDMDDTLISHIDAFRHFLMNDKLIPPERKIHYSSFIKFIRNLSVLKIKKDKIEIHSLKQKISEDKSLLSKDWLLEKIGQLND